MAIYVAITGLRLRRFWDFPRFYWHSSRCFRQARAASGNLRAEVRTIDGVWHTLTVWASEAHMREFLHSGAHGKAIAVFPSIATGKTFGFETDLVPTWEEARALWRAHGRDYAPRPLIPPREPS